MRRFGLVGNPLTHSWSEIYFCELFRKHGLSDCTYELFPKASLTGFRRWIHAEQDLAGLNITIPFKVAVMKELDEIDPVASGSGAVNTIKIIRKQGVPWLKGFNTDVDGFRGSLPNPFPHQRALILGSGGASKSVAYVFREMGIDFRTVSRNTGNMENLTYDLINRQIMEYYTVIVNTTPLGMYPETESSPKIPYKDISPQHLLIDLIYNPEETMFLKSGKAHGAQTNNGLKMLQIQAEKALSIFTSG
ncbi:MAG: shikimate dehydrogenase [bacterium]